MSKKNNRVKKKIEYILIPRVSYLKNVKARLQDEVGNYFEMLNESNKVTLRKIGFWSSIRLLMPIIETTATTLGLTSQEVLEKLDVKTPHLAWEMFRHPLLHGDQLSHIKYMKREINWGLTIGSGKSGKHLIGLDHISLDINYLYEKLVDLLQKEINKNDMAQIKVAVGIIFDDTAPDYILKDLEKVKKPFQSSLV